MFPTKTVSGTDALFTTALYGSTTADGAGEISIGSGIVMSLSSVHPKTVGRYIRACNISVLPNYSLIRSLEFLLH